MPFTVKDRVRETSVTTGVGEYTLGGAPVGFQAFSAIGAGNTCPYFATDNVNWEVGIGTVLAGPARLQRTLILASSNGGAAVNWGVGTREIICGMPAARAPFLNADNVWTGLNTFAAIITAAITASGVVSIPDGSAAAPSLKVGDEQNGLYSPAANQLGVALAGAAAANWSATGLRLGSANAANSPLDVQADASAIGVTAIGRAADGVSTVRGVNNAYSAELGSIRFENGQLKITTGNGSTERMRFIDSNGTITTGGTAAAATGYTAAGDITLPAAGAIRAKNTLKAEVNFDGTGTVSIRQSFNVSSITDNGVGNYTANLTNAFSAATQSVTFGIGVTTAPNTPIPQITAQTTSSVSIQIVRRDTGALDDSSIVCMHIAGD